MSDLRAVVEGLEEYGEWCGQGSGHWVGAITKKAVLALIPEGSVLVTEATLADALRRAEVGCIGFGGFHDGNDETVHHRRQAAAILARLRGEK